MSCSYVVDQPPEKSDSLVIIVNNDSTVSVDPETLRQSLLESHKKSSVSVVRVEPPSQNGHGSSESLSEEDQEETLHVNLTIEGFYSPQVTNSNTMTTSNPIDSTALEGDVVDPFSALDSEQLERLETALQSEQAKQILGEDVTAMLDVLNDDSDHGFTDHIHFDHCYTNLLPRRRIPPQHLQQMQHFSSENAVRGRGKQTRGVRGARREGVAGRGRVQQIQQDISSMHIPQELRPPPNSPASATLVPLVKPLVLDSTHLGAVTPQKQNAVTAVKTNAAAGTPIKVVSASGGVTGTAVPVVLQGTSSTGQHQVFFMKLPDGKLRPVRVAQRRVITQTTTPEGQVIQQQQPNQHILIQGQQNVQVVQLSKAQPIQVVQEKPSVIQEQQQQQQQQQLVKQAEQRDASLQRQFVVVGGGAQRTPGEDALLSPSEGEGSETGDGVVLSPKSRMPRTRGVLVRGTPLGRVVRGGRGAVATRGLVTRGGVIKARGTRIIARGGRGGRPRVPSEVDSLAREMEAALENMSSKKDDTDTLSPLSPRQEKMKAKAGRLKSTEEREDDGMLSDEPHRKPGWAKKAARSHQDSSSMDVMKSPPGARKTYTKKSSSTPDALPKGQTLLSFPVVQPTAQQELLPDTAQLTPTSDKTQEKTDTTKDAQTPGALGRKNYPKRENRKPPAHLAEALGPALFSTPDIIRRVDHKGETPKSKNAPPLLQSPTGSVPAMPQQSPAVIVQPTDMLGAIEPNTGLMAVEEMGALPEETAQQISLNDILPMEMTQGHADQMEQAVAQHQQEKMPAVTVIMNAAPGQPDEQSLLESIHAEVAKSDDDLMHGSLALDELSDIVEPAPSEVKVGRAAARKAGAHVKERLQEVDSVLAAIEAADEDFDDDMGSGDESWNSEDDPERLWCICRQPHNNRFMICCDGCEEWFHGQCVGITKLMGQRMEERGQDWSCPKCKKAKEEKKVKGSPKSAKKDRRESSMSESESLKSPTEPSLTKEPKSSAAPKDTSHVKTALKATPVKAAKEVGHRRKSIEGKSPAEPKTPATAKAVPAPKTAPTPKEPKTLPPTKEPKTVHTQRDPRTPQVSKEPKVLHPAKEAKVPGTPKDTKAPPLPAKEAKTAGVRKDTKTQPSAETKLKTPAKKVVVGKEAKPALKDAPPSAHGKEPATAPAKPATPTPAPAAKQPVKGMPSHAVCVGCKKATARPETIYCSDDCIKEYCEEIIKVLSNDYATPLKPDHRIPVMEKKTGRLLQVTAGENSSNLAPWLCSNPTFEVLRPSIPSSRGSATHPHGPPQRPSRPPAPTPPSAKKPKKLTSTASMRAHQAALEQQQILEQSRKDAVNAEIPMKNVKPKQVALSFHLPKSSNESPQGPQGPLGPAAKPQPAAASSKTPEGSKPAAKLWKLKQTQLLFAPSTPVPVKAVTPQSTKSSSGQDKTPTGSETPPSGPPGSLGFVVSKNRKGQTTLVQRTASTDNESTAKKRLLSPDTPTPPDKVKQRIPLVAKAPRKVEKKPSTSDIQPRKSIDAGTPSTVEKEESEKEGSKVDPIRATTLKMLKETLMARIKVCQDLNVSEEEIEKIVASIEEEMFGLFRDTGIKYKAKYRSLIFNIRDLKNETLFRRIADGSITPSQLVRLSAEEMASQELARWRELQAQHQLEMIRKNELDLLQRAKSVVMKTHKGEQEIETEGVTPVPEIDPNTTVTDLVSALNDSVTSTTVEEVEVEQRELTMKEREQERREKEKEQKRRDEQEKELASRSRRGSRDRHSRRDKDDRKKSRHRSRKKTDRDKSRERSRSTRDKSRERDRSHDKSHDTKEDKEKEKDHHHRSRSRSRATGKDSKRKTSKDHGTSRKRDSKDEEAKEESEPQATDSDSQKKFDEIDVSDHEPSSTVLGTPETNAEDLQWSGDDKLDDSVLWRGVVCVPDVARLDTYASPLSGDCTDLMKEFRDVILCCGRIPPKTMWDYILKMRKSCSKDIVVLRFDLSAATDQKAQFMSFHDYLTSRNRLGVVKIPSTMIKDFYIFSLTSDNPLPQAMLPLGLTFEENRPNIMIGVIVLNRRKRALATPAAVLTPPKVPRILPSTPSLESEPELTMAPPASFSVLQKTVSESLSPTLSPSLRSNLPVGGSKLDDEVDDENEPYSPGAGESDNEDSSKKLDDDLLERTDEEELRLRREELSRKIAEQKQQIQSINSAIGQISPWEDDEENEAYSPSRSITPTTPPADLNMEPILGRTPGSFRPILVRDPIVQNFGLLDPEPLDTSDLLSEERPPPHPIVDYFTLPAPSTSSNVATDSPPTAVPAPAPVPAPVTRDPRVDPRVEARPSDPRVDPRTDPRVDSRLVDPRVDPRVERRTETLKKSSLSELTDEDLIRKAETQIAEQMASEVLPRTMNQPPPPGLEAEVGYSTATPPPMPYPPPTRPSPFAPDMSLTAGSGYTTTSATSSDPSTPGTSLTSRLGRAPRSPPARAGGRLSPSDSAGSRRRRSYSSRHGRDDSSDSSDSDSSDASGSSGKSSSKRSSSRWSDGKPPSPSERRRSRSRERFRDRDKDREHRDKRGRDHSRDWEYDHREHRDRSAPFAGPAIPGAPPGPVGPLGAMPPGGPMRGMGWGDRGRFRGGFPGRGMFRGRGDFRKGGPGRQWGNRGPPSGPAQYHGDIHDNSQFEGDIRNFEKHRARTMKMRRKDPKDKSWER